MKRHELIAWASAWPKDEPITAAEHSDEDEGEQ